MTKFLGVLFKWCSGFIFVVLFFKCIGLMVDGIKWLIGKIGTWRISIRNNIRAMKSNAKLKAEEKRRIKAEKKAAKEEVKVEGQGA